MLRAQTLDSTSIGSRMGGVLKLSRSSLASIQTRIHSITRGESCGWAEPGTSSPKMQLGFARTRLLGLLGIRSPTIRARELWTTEVLLSPSALLSDLAVGTPSPQPVFKALCQLLHSLTADILDPAVGVGVSANTIKLVNAGLTVRY